MARKQHQQKLPHAGVQNAWKRKGRIIKDADGKVVFRGQSISVAKHYMRTGDQK